MLIKEIQQYGAPFPGRHLFTSRSALTEYTVPNPAVTVLLVTIHYPLLTAVDAVPPARRLQQPGRSPSIVRGNDNPGRT